MNFKYLSLLIIALSIFSSCTKEELEYTGNDLNKELVAIPIGSHTAIETELFDLINNHRVSIGLNELTFDNTTYYYAGQHNKYMISQNKISHDKFVERAKNVTKKTGAAHVAENVARNYNSMQMVFEAWLDSQSHRRALEGNYSHSAINITETVEGNLYFTQMFYRK